MSNWDKERYDEIKECTLKVLGRGHFSKSGTFEDFREHIQGHIRLSKDCEEREDFEAAKAVKDAVTEFLNRHLSDECKIPDDAILKHEL